MAANVLVWFKRDLRVADHPALVEAAGRAALRGGAVLPLFIAEPGLWARPDAAARQWRFVAESLQTLRADLAALGAPLVVRFGAAEAVLAETCAAHGIGTILSTEETGTLWTYARDRRVAAWARGAGLDWIEVPQFGVVRRLSGRDGWAARRGRAMRGALLAAPAGLAATGAVPGAIPDARDLGLGFDPCPGRQKGGRGAAEALLASFLAGRGRAYRRAMSSPVGGAEACSRLSPHLAWGVLSPRAVVQAAAAARAAAAPDTGWPGALRSFEARLAWRDHFVQKLEDAPALEARCLHRATEALRPRVPDAARLAAWEGGETGLPFVDACMRYLAHGGWLNFRMRAMLVSVAAYHLWLDWRATGPHLARRFTDYEPGIHWPQMQMQSGTTGMNTIRIYNPVKQGRDQDPDGRFTRAWVPELAAVPDAHLHAPWTWSGAGTLLGKRYPAPVVDLAQAARAARSRVWALRATPGFGAEAAALVARHGSRKAGAERRHFVDDRAPRRRRDRPGGDARQMRLDL